ncbi:MAG: hypothetical protein LKF48_04235 [Prevotella sp.]|jgi:hypothetical protein|nr:hypothetical protein [Prevotella sp.]MCH4182362.1 hypothetical protein [Prevotella sp.]MCH4212479.1 hypothetical protein [Prevotella sp.]MCH4240710.1 hypothetical protein [Prevotella sp.]MCI1742093.1 hypothetical protein [Prevotella sp.]
MAKKEPDIYLTFDRQERIGFHITLSKHSSQNEDNSRHNYISESILN